MAVVRFLFVPGTVGLDSATPRWPAEWGSATEFGWGFADRPTSVRQVYVGWRLVGANNRELGRSSKVYADLAACRAAVLDLQRNIASAQPVIASSLGTRMWTWRLDIGGRWVASAGRLYQRRRECQHNLAQFIEVAPTAVSATDIVVRTRGRELRQALRIGDAVPQRAAESASRRARPAGVS
jgi:hypothetical protein